MMISVLMMMMVTMIAGNDYESDDDDDDGDGDKLFSFFMAHHQPNFITRNVAIKTSSLEFLLTLLRYVPFTESSSTSGLEFKWPQGDKTLVQLDHSSVSPESAQIEVMSLYRMLVLLEKQKRVSDHKLSYSEVSRLEPGSGQSDSFKVVIKEPQIFKFLTEDGKASTCKSFFSACSKAVDQSPWLQPVFRWRFERVHGNCKLQKPYVILSAALECKAAQPVHVA